MLSLSFFDKSTKLESSFEVGTLSESIWHSK